MKIIAKPSLDPNVYDFIVEPILYPEGHLLCEEAGQYDAYALPRTLFALGNIQQLLIQKQTVTVRKLPNALWPQVARQVGQALRELLTQKQQSDNLLPQLEQISSQPLNTTAVIAADDVQRVVDAVLNPQVAQHGGHIAIDSIRDGQVYVKMSGGCQGCSQSSVTLQQGLQQLIRQHFPSLNGIVDLTQHQEGQNPYY